MMRDHMHRLEDEGLPTVQAIEVFSDVRRRNWKHFLTRKEPQHDADCDGCDSEMHPDPEIADKDKTSVLIYFCERCLMTRRVYKNDEAA